MTLGLLGGHLGVAQAAGEPETGAGSPDVAEDEAFAEHLAWIMGK
ncbi:hypothetical protein ACFYQT_41325 [Streptomyces tibetensis]|uniref:Uncharacterized protein n=1 Tax=Streptomyces tibetensis TaxID=2382123 RepID=A0ABW6NB27_9ACTN